MIDILVVREMTLLVHLLQYQTNHSKIIDTDIEV